MMSGNSAWKPIAIILGSLIGLLYINSMVQDSRERAATEARIAEEKKQDQAKHAAREIFKAMPPEEHLAKAKEIVAARGNMHQAKLHLAEIQTGSKPWAEAQALTKQAIRVEQEKLQEARKATLLAQKKQREDPGPAPNTTTLTFAIERALKSVAHDPDSIADTEAFTPSPSKVGAEACWKVPFSYRGRNGFGALRKSTGTVWVKNGVILKEQLN